MQHTLENPLGRVSTANSVVICDYDYSIYIPGYNMQLFKSIPPYLKPPHWWSPLCCRFVNKQPYISILLLQTLGYVNRVDDVPLGDSLLHAGLSFVDWLPRTISIDLALQSPIVTEAILPIDQHWRYCVHILQVHLQPMLTRYGTATHIHSSCKQAVRNIKTI